jgi:LacI family repressor for deo operon, udp, cdd, tsx, nupC, and nupG
LGYQPHPFARALRGKGTNLLGLIVRKVDDAFFAELTESISNVAGQEGYELVLGYANERPDRALTLSEVFDLRSCDGLFLVGDLKEYEDQTFLERLVAHRLVVSLSRGSQDIVSHTPSVSVDNRKGTFLALNYLASLGHRQIAFIDGSRQGDLLERMDAYRSFMAAHLRDQHKDLIQSGENSYAGGYGAMGRLLALPSPPTAVLAADDTMAIGALRAAWDAGYEVPKDLSVIGFDDIKVAAYSHPPLTTIRQSAVEIAQRAVPLLLQMVREESVPSPLPHYLVEPQLVVRGSCAAPRVGEVARADPSAEDTSQGVVNIRASH